MSFWRKSLLYSALMILQAAAQRIGGLIANGLLARMLTPADWGSVQAITTVAGALTQTLKLSVDGALQVRIAETDSARAGDRPRAQLLGAAVVLVSLLAAAALLIGTGFAPQAARFFGNDASLERYMGLAGLLAALQLGAQLNTVCAALGNFHLYARVMVYSTVASVVLVAVPYALGARGIWVALLATLVSQLVVTLGSIAMALRTARQHGLSPRFIQLRAAGADLIRLGLPLHLAGAVPAAVALFLNAKVARISGVESLAALRVVAMINQIVGFAPGALAITFVTQFATARGRGDNVPTVHFLRYLRVIIASTLLTALAAATVKPYLVRAAFGAQYVGSAYLVDLGLISVSLNTFRQALVVGLVSERRTGYALVDSLVTTLTSAVLGQLLIPQLQAAGFLVADLLGNLSSVCVLVVIFSVRLRAEGRGLELLRAMATLACGVGILTASYLKRAGGPHVAALAGVFAAMLLAMPFVLFTRQERELGRLELGRLRTRYLG